MPCSEIFIAVLNYPTQKENFLARLLASFKVLHFTPESLIETVNKFEKNPKKLTINLKRYLYKENKNKLKKIVKSLLKQGNGGSEIFK